MIIMSGYLKHYGSQLESESNKKVSLAMRLFIKCDDKMKASMLYDLGLDKSSTAKEIREIFILLELLDAIDNVIFDMEKN